MNVSYRNIEFLKNISVVRQKTIYEYDRVDLKSHPNVNITNGTAIIFTPYTTCQQLQTCQDCTTAQLKFKVPQK